MITLTDMIAQECAAWRKRAEQAESAREWQPIETAPKDGTWILVYEPCEALPTIHVVRWGTREWSFDKAGMSWVTMELGPIPDNYDADDATHWMPLPEPPR